MLKILKENNRLYETIFMGFLTSVCFGLSVFRLFYTDSTIFLFLNWNLFLAFIPWALTSFVIISPKIHKTKIIITLLLISWLLFFPNAPYILTDLFHLKDQSTMPIWFDLVLILSFAWTGLLFGLLSLWDIETILRRILKTKSVAIFSTILLFVGSFGIYIGRYLRWNSWDIITEPYRLIYDISDKIINPLAHPRAWGMTLSMGLFLNMIYWTFHFVKKRMV